MIWDIETTFNYHDINQYEEDEEGNQIATYGNQMAQVLHLCTEKQTEFVLLQVYKKIVHPPFAFFKNYLFTSVTFDVVGLKDANFGYTKVYSDFNEAKEDNFSKLGEIKVLFDINHD